MSRALAALCRPGCRGDLQSPARRSSLSSLVPDRAGSTNGCESSTGRLPRVGRSPGTRWDVCLLLATPEVRSIANVLRRNIDVPRGIRGHETAGTHTVCPYISDRIIHGHLP
jgi:hypothetical protein